MTTLGLIFIVLFVAALIKGGRRALALAIAAAVPFNDSVAVIGGGFGVSPFYVGIILYIGITVVEWIVRPHSRPARQPEKRIPWLKAFGVYAVAITAIAPLAFAGMGVIASGVGLDEQVNNLSALTYSPSNIAQVAYLVLASTFVFLNESDRVVGRQFLWVAFAVGILAAIATDFLGLHDLFSSIFDNSPRGSYAVNRTRLRGQFSEPSHLGAFALAASAFFLTATLQARRAQLIAANGVLAALSVVALVLSASGTGIVGLMVAILVTMAAGVARALRPGTSIKPATMLAAAGLLIATIIAYPFVWPTISAMINDKRGGDSYVTRTFSNNNAIRVFYDSYSLGVGIGSNRASSLLLMMLSTVGLVGTLLLLAVLWNSINRSLSIPDRLPAAITLIAYGSAAMVSIADFASPILWTLIAACYVSTRHSEIGSAVAASAPASAVPASKG